VARCTQSTGCLSESRFDTNHNTVRLWPLLDRIPFNHRNRFYHQDAPSSLQARRVGDSTNLGPSPPPPPVSFLLYPPSLTRTLGYCRTRTLLVPSFGMFPQPGCCYPHLRRQSTECCALLAAGGRSFVRAHLSMTTKRRITVLWWSGTRPTSYPAQRAVQSRKKLPWTSSTNSSRHPGLHQVVWRHGGDLTPRTRHVPDLVPQWTRHRGCRSR
jgi:hypothetical protein